MGTIGQRQILGNILYHINYTFILCNGNPLLRKISKNQSLPRRNLPLVGLFQAHNHIQKSTLTNAVWTHNANFLTALKCVSKIPQNGLRTICLFQVLNLQNLGSQTLHLHAKLHLLLHIRAFHLLGQIIESINPTFTLGCTRFGHLSHPFQLPPKGIAILLSLTGFNLFAHRLLLYEIAVIPLIRIQNASIQLQYFIANTIQKITIVRHQQQRQIFIAQILFQPLNHIQIQVVGRLIQNQQIGHINQNPRQSHTLLLSATQHTHRLNHIRLMDVQFAQYLLRPGFVIPTLRHRHFRGCQVQPLFRFLRWGFRISNQRRLIFLQSQNGRSCANK